MAIRNAAQQWEGVRACLELPPSNGAKEEVSPENSPAHSPAQSNGLTQESSPDEPRYMTHLGSVENGRNGWLLGIAPALCGTSVHVWSKKNHSITMVGFLLTCEIYEP